MGTHNFVQGGCTNILDIPFVVSSQESSLKLYFTSCLKRINNILSFRFSNQKTLKILHLSRLLEVLHLYLKRFRLQPKTCIDGLCYNQVKCVRPVGYDSLISIFCVNVI